jgi:glutamate 5-kinase
VLTTVDGVYDKHPDETGAQLISVIDPSKEDKMPDISSTTSTHGRGGMISKLGVARKLSGLGVTTHIANIANDNVLLNLVKGVAIGSTVIADKKKSNIKRWMAFSDWQKNGSIQVNAGLFDLLKSAKSAISILPVGLEACTGDFSKGDLIEVVSPGKQQIGIGIARYDSKTLRESLGKKNMPEIIHYDHLHIKIGT